MSTRRLDEGEKREAYFTLPSLKYFILLEQDSKGAVFYRRDAGQWSRVVHTDPNTGFHFLEIEAHLTCADIYAGLEVCIVFLNCRLRFSGN